MAPMMYPNEVKTEKQRVLADKHGTPYEFAISAYSCTLLTGREVEAAIYTYLQEWEEAEREEEKS